jgi:beta-glucanase (GH16 family)
MSRQILILIFIGFLNYSEFAQIYPPNLLYNGCSYSYNGYTSPDTIKCRKIGYKLSFEDLFDSTSLNSNKWGTAYPWGRALHSSYYGTGWDQSYMLDENISVAGGLLHILIKEDPSIHPSPDNPSENVSFNYSAGMLFSKANFIRGKFEIKCKIPSIGGLWPAFWMYGFCAQELDVFEFVNGSETSDPDVDSGNMIMTYHRQYDCKDTGNGSCNNGFTKNTGKDLSLDFHIYSLEWNEHKIIWRLDNEIVREVYKYWVLSPSYPDGSINGYAYPIKDCNEMNPNFKYTEFTAFPLDDNPMHVIVGSSVRLKEHVKVPQEFLVDYIRVYEEEDLGPNKNNENIFDFKITPNPTQESFSIPQRIVGQEILKIEVLNAFGLQVKVNITLEKDTYIVNLGGLPKGVYFVSVLSNGQSKIKKIIYY